MPSVKVLPKGQITLPKEIRESLQIREGDTLVVEPAGDRIVLKKGKTIFDFVGVLPNRGLTIAEIREKAVAAGVAEDG